MEITEGSIICRKINLVFNKLDDEVVMLSMENNEYYGLNIIGSRIWELIEKPILFTSLIDQLISEFDVEQIVCEKDTREFLNKLDANGLIEITTKN